MNTLNVWSIEQGESIGERNIENGSVVDAADLGSLVASVRHAMAAAVSRFFFVITCSLTRN
jgi:hypothetical protein